MSIFPNGYVRWPTNFERTETKVKSLQKNRVKTNYKTSLILKPRTILMTFCNNDLVTRLLPETNIVLRFLKRILLFHIALSAANIFSK